MIEHDVSDTLARHTFIAAVIGTILYVLVVFVFVLGNNPEEQAPQDAAAQR